MFRKRVFVYSVFLFFNDTATTEIYTLSLHDALPISPIAGITQPSRNSRPRTKPRAALARRSEEHTSELQSHHDLVYRLLLEKKKKQAKKVTQSLRINLMFVQLQRAIGM